MLFLYLNAKVKGICLYNLFWRVVYFFEKLNLDLYFTFGFIFTLYYIYVFQYVMFTLRKNENLISDISVLYVFLFDIKIDITQLASYPG